LLLRLTYASWQFCVNGGGGRRINSYFCPASRSLAIYAWRLSFWPFQKGRRRAGYVAKSNSADTNFFAMPVIVRIPGSVPADRAMWVGRICRWKKDSGKNHTRFDFIHNVCIFIRRLGFFTTFPACAVNWNCAQAVCNSYLVLIFPNKIKIT
jgi:hypothetical protein